MNEQQIKRNRRIIGTLLAVRNAPPGDYDVNAMFAAGAEIDEFTLNPNVSAVSMLIAAQFVGEAARSQLQIEENAVVGLNLPPVVESNPDLLAAFRLATVIMNHDVETATAITKVIITSRSRSRNVIACLLGMLMEAPAPVG